MRGEGGKEGRRVREGGREGNEIRMGWERSSVEGERRL